MTVDILIMYEVKSREIDSIVLLGTELKKRGYFVEYMSFADIHKRSLQRKYRNKVKMIIMPSLYHDEELRDIVYRVAGRVRKILNLRWEQVFTNTVEKDYSHYVYPKGAAKKAMCFCWGEREREQLIQSGYLPDRLAVTGPISMDFTRPELRRYYLSREELLREFRIDPANEVVLFISSFVSATLRDSDIREIEAEKSADHIRTIHAREKEIYHKTLSWIEEYVRINREQVFIYRPHPNENITNELRELANQDSNFLIVTKYSVKQWIMTCNYLFTRTSTSIIEAFFAGVPCAIVRAFPIEQGKELAVYRNANIIDDLQTFIRFSERVDSNGNGLDPNIVRSYYDFDETLPSYQKAADAIETILRSEETDFEWTDEIIDGFEKSKVSIKAFFHKPYLALLRALIQIQNKCGIQYVRPLEDRIQRYLMMEGKLLNRRATKREIQTIEQTISQILSS